MSYVVALFGIFFTFIGVSGLIFPGSIIAFIYRWHTQAGLYLATIIRIVLGVALLIAASTSRAPLYLVALGIVAIIAGVATPFFGLHRFKAVLDWWSLQSSLFIRVWLAVVVLFGLSLVWAVWPPT